MGSNINPVFPEEIHATTQSVRDNFSAAKTEIEALQNNALPITGGEITGDLVVDGIFDVSGTFAVSSSPSMFTGELQVTTLSVFSGGASIQGELDTYAQLYFHNLPTVDPHQLGQAWMDVAAGRVLKISNG